MAGSNRDAFRYVQSGSRFREPQPHKFLDPRSRYRELPQQPQVKGQSWPHPVWNDQRIYPDLPTARHHEHQFKSLTVIDDAHPNDHLFPFARVNATQRAPDQSIFSHSRLVNRGSDPGSSRGYLEDLRADPHDPLENTPKHWSPRHCDPPPHQENGSLNRERANRDGRVSSPQQSCIPPPQHYTSSQWSHWPEQQPHRTDVDLKDVSSQTAVAIPDKQHLPSRPISPCQDQFFEDNTDRDHDFEPGYLRPALKKTRSQEPELHPSRHRNFRPPASPSPSRRNQIYQQPQLRDRSFVHRGSSSLIAPNKDEIGMREKQTDDSQISLDQQPFGYRYESQMPSDQTRLPLPPLPHSPTLPHCFRHAQAGAEYSQDRILTRACSGSIQGTTGLSRSRYEPIYSSEWDSTRQSFSVSPQDITSVIDDPKSRQAESNLGTRLPTEESDYNILRESTIGGDLRQHYPWESRPLIPFQRNQSPVDLENAVPSYLPTSPFTPTRFNPNRRQSIPTQRSTNTKPSALSPISEPTTTYPAIQGLRGGDANHGRANSTSDNSIVSDAATFQDTCVALPRQRPLWRIGHAGYYRKEDLEDLYNLWRSQYESKDSSLLSLCQTGNKDGSMDGNVKSERTRHAAEEWGNSSNENVDKGKDAWQDMDTEFSFVGRDDIGFRGENMKKSTRSSREIMSVVDIKDGTAKQDLARSSDSSEVKIATCTNQVNGYTNRGDSVEEIRKEDDEDREFEEKEGEEEGNPNESRQEEIASRDVDGSESDQCQSTETKTGDFSTGSNTRRPRAAECKNYRCKECGKCFSRPSQLATHSLTHSGEKPHQCAMCQRYFNVASNLKRHIRTHTDTKRKSLRNGGMVFRSFSHGFQPRLGFIWQSGPEEPKTKSRNVFSQSSLSSATTAPSQRPSKPSRRLHWVNTEIPKSSSSAANLQVRDAERPKPGNKKDAGYEG